ncbi:hypothetical protein [Marivirga harenae]|uniref:hypothetical protein n=1 Tax=Marivirga harenae TaxID=2010992 RepID=UPI0026DF0ADB|nr:hypothetical protein [Marivirga harenae]WKV11045.1 hypothetical protein Q3Y49_12560 [Marivirga harenae]|tara:strand:+ start:137361 stop:138053 length:693 start_codon:yes stop_codon:yes gene_type:complete
MKTIYEPSETKWDIAFLKTVNVKVVVFCTISLFLFSSTSLSQNLPQEMWHPGFIVLDSEDTLQGKIQYDFESNLVQYTTSKTVKTFTSQKILFFKIHCQFFKRVRLIYSIPYELKGRVKTPVFFEILEEGKITLMAREYVTIENNNRFGNPMYRTRGGFGRREILTYDYFLLTDDGEIHKFSEKKKDLMPFFGKLEPQMKDYIKDKRLKVDRQGDLVIIMNYYNELVSSR